MEYISVKNLEKYHPGYKDRELQWCKVYFKMINAEPEIEGLCEIDKWRYICFIMLQLQTKTPLPLSPPWLVSKGFDLKKRPIQRTIDMLHNFVEVVTQLSDSCVVDKNKIRVYNKEIDKEEEREEKRAEARPLSLLEVETYMQDKTEANTFWNHFNSNGWKVGGKAPMKDWKSAATNWMNRVGKSIVPPENKIVPKLEGKELITAMLGGGK